MNRAVLAMLMGHSLFIGMLCRATQELCAQGTDIAGQSVAATEHFVDPGSIKLDVLISELLKQNPALQAERKKLEAALTRRPQESALPDPRITVGWIGSGGPWPGAGLGMEPTSNIGFQVAQELPYPGKRALKSGMAYKEAESQAQLYRSAERSLVAQLKNNFHELRFVFEALELVQRNQTLLRKLAKASEIRYTVGQGTQQDLVKSEVEAAILESKRILFEQQKIILAARINSLLNRPPASPLGRPEPLGKVPSLGPLESFRNRVQEESPTLRAQQANIDSRELAVQLARRQYYPDLDLMGGYYNQGNLKDMWEFKLQFKVPLYFWQKQRYGLEEAGLRLVESQRTFRSTEQILVSQLVERYSLAETSQRLMDLYSKRIIPQSNVALESSLASYESGKIEFLSVLSNFTTILDYEMSYLQQRAEYMKALASLEELLANSLETANGNEVQK